MTITAVQAGNVIDSSAVATIASRDVVGIGNIIVVALGDIANGATGSVATRGVFTVPKVSGAVIAQGEKLIWDISANTNAGAFDDSAASPATGDVTGGAIAWVAGTDGQTTCTIKLTPGNATIT